MFPTISINRAWTSIFLCAAVALFFGMALALAVASAPAFAEPGPCKGPNKNDPGCGGIVYEATLTMGAFKFMCHSTTPCSTPGKVIVTPNTREDVLRSNTDLDMVRPTASDLEATWNAVFNACEEILGTDSVFKFFVANDEWRISKAGGVTVVFRDIGLQGIELEGTEVRVQLIGDEFDFDDPFLPELDGESREYVLTQFEVTGTPVRGKGAIKSCRGTDGGGPLLPPSTLVITASE